MKIGYNRIKSKNITYNYTEISIKSTGTYTSVVIFPADKKKANMVAKGLWMCLDGLYFMNIEQRQFTILT